MFSLGDWLKEAEWCHVISEVDIATSGKAESFLTASHVKRTRYGHEVTAAVLHILMNKSYQEHWFSTRVPRNFEDWKKAQEKEFPQFRFWSTTLNLELLLLEFVRSIRSADFSLYKESIRKLLPWFFSIDHTNYARWLSIHLYDMLELPKTNPIVNEYFEAGRFVITKTKRKFSSIGIDHAHEQNNKCVKGDGGMKPFFPLKFELVLHTD